MGHARRVPPCIERRAQAWNPGEGKYRARNPPRAETVLPHNCVSRVWYKGNLCRCFPLCCDKNCSSFWSEDCWGIAETRLRGKHKVCYSSVLFELQLFERKLEYCQAISLIVASATFPVGPTTFLSPLPGSRDDCKLDVATCLSLGHKEGQPLEEVHMEITVVRYRCFRRICFHTNEKNPNCFLSLWSMFIEG